MTAPVMYGEHERIAPGTPCLLCGPTERPVVMDHCHTHGWKRGPLCSRCNALMAFIDRRVLVRESSLTELLTLAALVEHAARCPGCEPFKVEDLGPTRQLRMRRTPNPVKVPQVNTRLPDDVHAALKAMAEQDHRSINAMLIVLVEEEQKRRAVPLH